jgi:predicted RNA-binding protein with PUA domain
MEKEGKLQAEELGDKMAEDNYERDETISACKNCKYRFYSDKCMTCKHRFYKYMKTTPIHSRTQSKRKG